MNSMASTISMPAVSRSARGQRATEPVRGLGRLLERLDVMSERGSLCLQELERLFLALELQPGDLAAFQLFSPRCYQRNRIRRTEQYEMLLICWAPGQGSPVHDHTGSACAFRVVSGRCTEQRFRRCVDGPEGELRARPEGETVVFDRGSVCVSEDADIHRVGNSSAQENLCTLHLYSPPLDAMRQYFDVTDREATAARA